MTLSEVAKEAQRARGVVHHWLEVGHLPGTLESPKGPDGEPLGAPRWFVSREDWEAAREKCLSLKPGPKRK